MTTQPFETFDSDFPTEGKTGTYTPDYTIRAAAPVILFDTKTPTDLQYLPRCVHCGNYDVDCLCAQMGDAS